MKLIVGLGNPGRLYRYTKHNVGFLVVEELAKECRIKLKTKRYGSVMGAGKMPAQDTILMMPVTYMNMSGKAVKEAIEEEGIGLDSLLVVCDDINLKLGTMRMRTKGSSGGHKGLDSIIHVLGSGDFARLRIGIATQTLRGDITEYVLSPFKKKDMKKIKDIVSLSRDACLLWADKGPEAAMAMYNVKNRTYG